MTTKVNNTVSLTKEQALELAELIRKAEPITSIAYRTGNFNSEWEHNTAKIIIKYINKLNKA